ncbi:DNA cytosine methyltransferase [[Phormidium] sp. ETS-05]|uniref:DNA cytosine methyltransferase n=1 Tax=[Phormidium] sp. ETS-05 TaxID=222819 RepID=UPI001E56E766|nr:DNA cytosine methyltransferase [[Phormidium] sp. ETS-05]
MTSDKGQVTSDKAYSLELETMTTNNNLNAIELFAGIGGFRLGMQAAGIETIWANDINPLSCQVYASNFGENSIVCGDIWQYPISAIPDHDLLTAGFPCQPFSPAGKKLGVRDGHRGTIFQRIAEIIQAKQPRYFLLENVKRILTMENGHHFKIILAALSELNYFIEWRLLNAVNFGIPQNRERVFILGTKLDAREQEKNWEGLARFLTDGDMVDTRSLPSRLKPLDHQKNNYNWGLCFQGRMWTCQLPPLPDIKPRRMLKDILQDDGEIDGQFDFTDDTRERIKASEAVNRFYNGVEILYNQKGGARLGYTIFGINGVASTLTASTSRHYERYQIGQKFRRLTNVEYARIMGFPDNWCRVARIYDQYALFGNAVVPDCVAWVCHLLLAVLWINCNGEGHIL